MKKILKMWWVIPILIALLLCYSTHWIFDTYDAPSFEQILFHITEPISGVESEFLYDFLTHCLLVSIIETVIIAIVMNYFTKILKKKKKSSNILIGCTTVISAIIIVICLYILGFFEYLFIGNTDSTFIEDNYVSPIDVKITFPDKKRNLIYIFAESLESSYLSIDEGGIQEENLLPELTNLAKENLSFSDTEKIGGAYQLNGTTWTTAAMVAHTAGIPLKIGRKLTNYYNMTIFLSGAYTLGDILFSNNYNQTIMFGSDGNFGNREIYFHNHGFYNVSDYYDAIEKRKIDNDYLVWWGYEDSKLFEYAKEEAIRLSQKAEPFNLTLLTVNTHHPDGYLEDGCPKIYDEQYKNVIACSSTQINEFIQWCKEQEFYENTTIIIVGDHLSMSTKFFNFLDQDSRRIFNTFINSAVEPINSTNRSFSTLDMFPTTLAAIGATIEGDRLALGTNLFSDKETLVEKYGIDIINDEFSYKSNFYNREILRLDD